MTSIEWLETELKKIPFVNPKEKFEKAKEMHKKEIIDTFFEGAYGGDNISGEQYYQETFGSKGSDAKDVVLGYKTSLDAQMLDSQLPQQDTEKEMFELEQQLDVPSYLKWYNRKPNEPRKTTSDKWKEYQDWINNKID
jgi:hypothetical protein